MKTAAGLLGASILLATVLFIISAPMWGCAL